MKHLGEELPTHGGSLRIYGRHDDDESKPVTERAIALHEREIQAGLARLGYESLPGEHPVVPLVVRDTPRTRALVAHLREFRPHVVTTYDEQGGTLPDGPGSLSDFNLLDTIGIVRHSGFGDDYPISLQLGIMNLLPIPVLDGGQIALILFEGAIRRDLSMQVKENMMKVGVVLRVWSSSPFTVLTAVSTTCPSRTSSAPKGWSPLPAASAARV